MPAFAEITKYTQTHTAAASAKIVPSRSNDAPEMSTTSTRPTIATAEPHRTSADGAFLVRIFLVELDLYVEGFSAVGEAVDALPARQLELDGIRESALVDGAGVDDGAVVASAAAERDFVIFGFAGAAVQEDGLAQRFGMRELGDELDGCGRGSDGAGSVEQARQGVGEGGIGRGRGRGSGSGCGSCGSGRG